MSLVKIEQIRPATFLGIWRIQEEESFFENQLWLDETERKFINSISLPQRRRQWLATRLLIRKIINPAGQILMEWNSLGKPVIMNYDFEVSISHAADLAVALVSTKAAGIDVEYKRDAVLKISEKFASPLELSFINNNQKIDYLTVYWAVKEATFKKIGGGGIDFKEHIQIEPFSLKEKGQGIVQFHKKSEQFTFHYEWIDNAVVVWIC